MDDHDLSVRFDAIDTRFDAIDARFERVEALIKAQGIETRRYFDVVAEGLEEKIKIVADGHVALRENFAVLREGQQRLEAGQSRLEVRQQALEFRQDRLETRVGAVEDGQKTLVTEVRLLTARLLT